MPTRSIRQNLTVGLLVPLLSALTAMEGARADDDSAWQPGTVNRGSLLPAFVSAPNTTPLAREAGEGQGVRGLYAALDVLRSVRPRYPDLRIAPEDSDLFTFCSNSDLDLPCRLYSSDESAVGVRPGSYVAGTPWPSPTSSWLVDDPAAVSWPRGAACGTACDDAGTSFVEPPSWPQLRWDGSRLEHLCDRCGELPARVCSDWKNFYSCRGLRDLLLGIGVGAILANTSLDQDFRDWYQVRVQNEDLDEFSRFWNGLGDGTYVIPAVMAVAAAGMLFDDTPLGGDLAEWGSRTLRAYLVGAPPVVFGQWALGGARPGESDRESRWTPFEFTHAISGHAFIGAVPFITAAKMTDCIWLKGGLYGLSVLPGWARVNRDKHYLSQAILGWWIACLSASAVDQTELSAKGYTVFPLVSSDMVGMGATCSW